MSTPRHDFNKSHAKLIDLRKTAHRPDIVELCQDWKRNFLRKYPWMLNVPEEFINDRFNVFGLQNEFQLFPTCVDIICGKANLSTIAPCHFKSIKSQLEDVYGLIHVRFALSPEGLNALLEKYNRHIYGTCPRVNCNDEILLPIGLSSKLHEGKIKTFCPCCREIFEARPRIDLDGAYFGPNVAHIFIDEMKIVANRHNFQPFTHFAFGFKIRSTYFGTEMNEEEEEDYYYSDCDNSIQW